MAPGGKKNAKTVTTKKTRTTTVKTREVVGRGMGLHFFARFCLFAAAGFCLWLLLSDKAFWAAETEGKEVEGKEASWLERLYPVLMGTAVFGAGAMGAGTGGRGIAPLVWPAFLGLVWLSLAQFTAAFRHLIFLTKTGYTDWGGCQEADTADATFCAVLSAVVVVAHLLGLLVCISAATAVYHLAAFLALPLATAKPNTLLRTVTLTSNPV